MFVPITELGGGAVSASTWRMSVKARARSPAVKGTSSLFGDEVLTQHYRCPLCNGPNLGQAVRVTVEKD